jgi:dihydrofolate synthase/folylpolyglutamate synthase
MTYAEAIDFLFNSLPVWERAGAGAYKPGIERIAAFVAALGLETKHNEADACFSRKPLFVHVAGTNGKGSVSHMLAAVLQKAGYRTGLFTSPHLVDFRERIRVDGEMIPESAVTEFTELYRDEMVASELTFFEMTTAMGLWWFSRAGCDIAVIETGLGGRLDSTNIITPRVSVITNVALEHTQYLGHTIAAIAAEKAGIIKAGGPVVIGETDPESAPVVRARAAQLGSEIVFADKKHFQFSIPDFQLDLGGEYQQKNLATVLAAVDILRRGLTIPYDALREGLAHAAEITGLRGRWQVVGRAPLVVLDTAHNAHGIAGVARQIARQPREKLYMVMGFAADKDLDAILPLLPADAHYILTRADTPRAMTAEELAHRLSETTKDLPPPPRERGYSSFPKEESATQNGLSRSRPLLQEGGVPEGRGGRSLQVIPSVPAAIEKALALATEKDMIFIGGSNFVVGEALAVLYN